MDFPFRTNTQMEHATPIMALDAVCQSSLWQVRDGEVPRIR
jgi:hypothetical protein